MTQFFSEDVIERVRDAADIVSVISEQISLKRVGRNYKALCPFHQEKTPSFSINSEKQIFKCFGCGKAGNVFHFLMEMEGLAFPEAVTELAKKFGVPLPEESEQRSTPSPAKGVLEALAWANVFFQKKLSSPQGEKAREYLHNRGFSPSVISEFQLGYAPDEWDALRKEGIEQGFSEQTLLEAGLLAKKNEHTYDRFRHRVIFPIANHRGKIVAFGGRVLSPEGMPKYLNSPESRVFSKKQTLYGFDLARQEVGRTEKPLLITEGYTDVIMAHQNGFKNTVATLGTALGDEHVSLISRYSKSVILIFDGDKAGIEAAQRSLRFFLSRNITVKVLVLPGGEDPYDFLSQNDAGIFSEHVEKAEDFFDFQIRLLKQKQGLSDVSSQRQALQELNQTLSLIPDEITQRLFLGKISQAFHLPPEVLLEKVTQIRRSKGTRLAPAATNTSRHKQAKAKEQQPNHRLYQDDERFLLSVVLRQPERAEEIFDKYGPEMFRDAKLGQIARHLEQRIRDGLSLESAVVASQLEAEIAQELISISYENSEINAEKEKQRLSFIYKGVARRRYKAKIMQLKQLAKTGNDEEAIEEILRDAHTAYKFHKNT